MTCFKKFMLGKIYIDLNLMKKNQEIKEGRMFMGMFLDLDVNKADQKLEEVKVADMRFWWNSKEFVLDTIFVHTHIHRDIERVGSDLIWEKEMQKARRTESGT